MLNWRESVLVYSTFTSSLRIDHYKNDRRFSEHWLRASRRTSPDPERFSLQQKWVHRLTLGRWYRGVCQPCYHILCSPSSLCLGHIGKHRSYVGLVIGAWVLPYHLSVQGTGISGLFIHDNVHILASCQRNLCEGYSLLISDDVNGGNGSAYHHVVSGSSTHQRILPFSVREAPVPSSNKTGSGRLRRLGLYSLALCSLSANYW